MFWHFSVDPLWASVQIVPVPCMVLINASLQIVFISLYLFRRGFSPMKKPVRPRPECPVKNCRKRRDGWRAGDRLIFSNLKLLTRMCTSCFSTLTGLAQRCGQDFPERGPCAAQGCDLPRQSVCARWGSDTQLVRERDRHRSGDENGDHPRACETFFLER